MGRERLRILFDATVLENSLTNKMLRTGVYFAAYNMAAGLAARDDVDMLFFTHKKNLLARYMKQHRKEFGGIPVFDDPARIPEPPDAYFSAWYPLADSIREYFPKISCYSVLYDIIGIVRPEYLLGMKLPAMWRMLNEFAVNDHYFAISQYTKNDVVRMGRNIDPDRISVIPLAANDCFRPNPDADALTRAKRKYGIPESGRYILSLCSLEPRKNLINAVNAFVKFVETENIRDLVFVLAGNPWAQFRSEMERFIKSLGPHADKLIITGYIDDEDISALYSNALWFVYTSHYEGFGLPPLEAMQCGCPVIVSNSTSLPEVVGDAGILLDSRSVDEHVAAYRRYYRDPDLRKENADRGRERARLFSWDGCVEIVHARMCADAAKKRIRPKISIVVSTNYSEETADATAFSPGLESIRAQTYAEKEVFVLDCGHDRDFSARIAEAANGFEIRSLPGADPVRSWNAVLPELSGEFATFPEPGFRYPSAAHFEICMAKSVESDALLSYTDSAGPDGITRASDVERIAIGGHFPRSAAFFNLRALRQGGGFPVEYASAALDAVVMRLMRDRRRIVRIRHSPVRVAGTVDGASPEEYGNAFFAVFGDSTTLSRAEFAELHSGDYKKNGGDSHSMRLAAKLPPDLGGWAIIRDVIAERHMGELLDDAQRESAASTRDFLLGFLPLSRTWNGDSLRNCATYRWRGLPVLKVIRRGVQTFASLFGAIPVFSRRNK